MTSSTSRRETKLSVFVQFAKNLSSLSTCKRLTVACIIFDDALSKVHAIGYNGQPAGVPHSRCSGVAGSCGCVHAEANALVKLDTPDKGLVLYTTHSPCTHCAGLIINSGKVSKVLYDIEYRDTEPINLLKSAGVECVLLDQRTS